MHTCTQNHCKQVSLTSKAEMKLQTYTPAYTLLCFFIFNSFLLLRSLQITFGRTTSVQDTKKVIIFPDKLTGGSDIYIICTISRPALAVARSLAGWHPNLQCVCHSNLYIESMLVTTPYPYYCPYIYPIIHMLLTKE